MSRLTWEAAEASGGHWSTVMGSGRSRARQWPASRASSAAETARSASPPRGDATASSTARTGPTRKAVDVSLPEK